MHGRKKRIEPLSKEEQQVLSVKAKTYKSLMEIIQTRRKAGDASAETFILTSKMLKSNPDVISLWNYRREILLTQHPLFDSNSYTSLSSASASAVDNSTTAAAILTSFQTELQLSADAIIKNPKSYGAWDHRRWMIEHVLMNPNISHTCVAGAAATAAACCCGDGDSGDGATESDITSSKLIPKTQVISSLLAELELCKSFLLVDERNFHCWNYRRFVVVKLVLVDGGDGRADDASGAGEAWNKYWEAEMSFSLAKIQDNFSNYSAYHHRSVYFALQTSATKKHQLPEELKMCITCMYTEPDDQSIYWYFKNLLSIMTDLFLPSTVCSTITSITDSTDNNRAPRSITTATATAAAVADSTDAVVNNVVTDVVVDDDPETLFQYLFQHIEILAQLVAIEPHSKWAKEGLLMTIEQYQTAVNRTERVKGNTEERLREGGYLEKVETMKKALLQNLQECDPNHVHRFIQLQVQQQ